MNEAGLRAVVLDVDLFALLNIFYLNYEAEKYRACIIINIGNETTDAAFLQNGVFHSAREIPIAGTNFQNQLNMAAGLPPEKIHDILNGKVDQDVNVDKVVSALNSVSTDFANAVGVAVSYFQTSDAIDKVDMIVLAGGYALIPGLVNILELRTGSEVIVLDPFVKVEYDKSIITPHDRERYGKVLSVAMGLATRSY
jgi:type IV pilus assembly protein PilM